MIRIKSVTDVITNSSTEVFIFNTTKTLEEVASFLEGATYGYEGPEVLAMENGGGKVMKAMLDYGYFVDPNSIDSLEKYWYYHVIDDGYFSYCYNRRNDPAWQKLRRAWKEYLMEHKDVINANQKGSYVPIKDTDTVETVDVSYYWLPSGIVKGFVEQYKDPLPGSLTWDVPEKMLAENYVGKIGIVGEGDNSIPFDTWDSLWSVLGGENWHLG